MILLPSLRRTTACAGLTSVMLVFTADRPSAGGMKAWTRERATAYNAARIDTVPGNGAGIPFGMFHLAKTEFKPPFTGLVLNGRDPQEVLSVLEAARRARMQVFLNMFVSPRTIKAPDGSFDLDRWKGRIGRFTSVDLEPYIEDGTLVGHYLLDEPQTTRKWNGKQVPYEDLEAAAEYSKRLWPRLATLVRADPVFLGKAPIRWVHLDAAWAQYASRRGRVEPYVARQVAAARKAGLGLVLGLNVLDGGDGTSRRRGTKSKYWAMSPAEVGRYGSVLAIEPYACALLLWKYDAEDTSYFSHPAIQAALGELGRLAADRPTRSCQVP
jgi:hypothetical protein